MCEHNVHWVHAAPITAYQHPFRLLFFGSGAPGFLGRGIPLRPELPQAALVFVLSTSSPGARLIEHGHDDYR